MQEGQKISKNVQIKKYSLFAPDYEVENLLSIILFSPPILPYGVENYGAGPR